MSGTCTGATTLPHPRPSLSSCLPRLSHGPAGQASTAGEGVPAKGSVHSYRLAPLVIVTGKETRLIFLCLSGDARYLILCDVTNSLRISNKSKFLTYFMQVKESTSVGL